MASETSTSNPTTNQAVVLQIPAPGQTVVVSVQPNQVIEVPFDMAEANVTLIGDDLRIEFPGNAVLILNDFATMVDQGVSPLMMFADGSVMAGDVLLTALTAELPETAAGPTGTSGGAGEYEDNMGDLLASVDRLGPQNPDPFAAVVELEQLGEEPAAGPAIDIVDPDNPDATMDNIRLPEGTVALWGVKITDAPEGATLTLALTDGTASDGDYNESFFEYSTDGGATWTAVSGPFAIPAGDSLLLVRTDTVGDEEFEGDETFVLTGTLTGPAGESVSASGTATIYDEFINTPPVAYDDAYTAAEDGTTAMATSILDKVDAGDPASDDYDVDGDALTVTEVNGSAASVGTWIDLADGGKVLVSSDGTFQFDADGDFNALALGTTDTTSFTYTISDGNGGIDTATVTITVEGANDAPVAVDNQYSVGEDDSLGIGANNIIANLGDDSDFTDPAADSDVDGDSVTVYEINGLIASVGEQITLASGALLTVNADGTFSYDPNGQFEGLDDGETATESFTYKVTDGDAQSNLATVTITINGANDPASIAVSAEDLAVYEAGLANGTNAAASSEYAYGTFTVADSDGLDDIASITVGGRTMVIGTDPGEFASLLAMVGQTVDVGYGTVKLTGYLDGTFSFEYKLDGNVDNDTQSDATPTLYDESFTVAVSDGLTSDSKAITVTIYDDAPLTANDYDGLTVNQDTGVGSTIGDVQLNDNMGADGPATGTDGAVTSVSFEATTSPVPSGGSVNIDGRYGTLTMYSDGTYSYAYTAEPGEEPVVISPENWSGITLSAFESTSLFDEDDLDLEATPDADWYITAGSKSGFGVNGSVGSNLVDYGEYLVFKLAEPIVGEFSFEIGAYNANQSDLGDMTWGVYGADGTLIDSGDFADLGGVANNNGTYTGAPITFDEAVSYIVFGMDDPTGSGYSVTNITYTDTSYPTGLEDFTYTVTDGDGDTSTAHLYITSDGFFEGNASGNVLTGGTGEDILLGHGGDDLLFGGAGNDILVGGEDADIFAYSATSGEGHDTITDFSVTEGDVLHIYDVVDGDPGNVDVDILVDGGSVQLTINSATQVTIEGLGSQLGWADGSSHELADLMSPVRNIVEVSEDPPTI